MPRQPAAIGQHVQDVENHVAIQLKVGHESCPLSAGASGDQFNRELIDSSRRVRARTGIADMRPRFAVQIHRLFVDRLPAVRSNLFKAEGPIGAAYFNAHRYFTWMGIADEC